MTAGLHKVIGQLQRLGGGPVDAQLLARFVSSRDEASFTALVHRHGSMVMGVCRRLLGDHHDAEDAFQATFLVLARKAAGVKRETLASWLYTVAYRTALEARAVRSRRRTRERQVDNYPHPAAPPPEIQDWRPLLDKELSRLPEKYRSPILLCDLEGRSRREVARQLGLPEGTLSSRLMRARARLAQRLSRQGVSLSAGTLLAALAADASAQVSSRLVWSTAQIATLVAAGQMAAVSTPAAALMKGVVNAMFMQKLKVVFGALMLVAALAAGGVAYRSGDAAAAPPEKQPKTEVEALRRENELLKLNLEVVLEKVKAQEAELKGLKENAHVMLGGFKYKTMNLVGGLEGAEIKVHGNVRLETNPAEEVEVAVKQLRDARDSDARKRAVEALEKAVQKLKAAK